jgi:hypothetical protein
VNWDASLHWSTIWFRLIVMQPWFIPSNYPVKHIFSFICILWDVAKTHSVNFFLILHILWAATMETLSKSSNDHAICCMLNQGNTLMQLLHCLSLSFCQFESTLPPAAQLLLLRSQQGDLVRHHLWLSNALERLSWDSCELLYLTNTSHCKETFLYEYPLH